MSMQIFIHSLEFIFSFIYVALIWPLYDGEDYLWGCFVCISYLVGVASYCILCSLLSAMKIACNLNSFSIFTWKRLALANLPWCTFVIMIALLFHNSLGYLSCAPIVIPNVIHLLYQIIKK